MTGTSCKWQHGQRHRDERLQLHLRARMAASSLWHCFITNSSRASWSLRTCSPVRVRFHALEPSASKRTPGKGAHKVDALYWARLHGLHTQQAEPLLCSRNGSADPALAYLCYEVGLVCPLSFHSCSSPLRLLPHRGSLSRENTALDDQRAPGSCLPCQTRWGRSLYTGSSRCSSPAPGQHVSSIAEGGSAALQTSPPHPPGWPCPGLCRANC